MSFSTSTAGTRDEVAAFFDDPEVSPRKYGEELGKLTADYLAAVAKLAGADRKVLVETNGHADTGGDEAKRAAQVTIRVVTLYP